MANSATYIRLLNLIQKWPVDKSKPGRDLGTHLREYIKKEAEEGKFLGNEAYWDRQYLSLQRLINNESCKKYSRGLSSSAVGLTANECNAALTDEFLNYAKKSNTTFLKRLFSKGKMISMVQITRRTLRKLCTQATENAPHIPVMVKEVLENLQPKRDQLILDMTFGAGGHSREILKQANVKLLALDRDPVALSYVNKLNIEFPGRVLGLHGRFSQLPDLLKEHNIKQNSIDGILCDFGCSSMQFEDAKRGFAVSKNGPLDMRMDGTQFPDSPTAADVLSRASEEDLYKIIKIYGEEKQARNIARAIIEARYLFKNLQTTQDLADLVASVCSEEVRFDKLQRPAHVATKTFQALRIFVNNELNEINFCLVLAQKYLKLRGRFVAITFHSLEDTIVKRHLIGNVVQNTACMLPLKYSSHSLSFDQDIIVEAMESNWKSLHKHVIVPQNEEVESNPRSRSAKLRAAIRIR